MKLVVVESPSKSKTLKKYLGADYEILASYGQGSGHVFNLGHGISQFTPPETVKVLVDCVHQSSAPYHRKGAETRAS